MMRSNRRLPRATFITKLVVAVIAIYASVSVITMQVQINAAAAQNSMLELELAALQKRRSKTLEALERPRDIGFVIEVGRERFKLAYPNEEIYVLIPG